MGRGDDAGLLLLWPQALSRPHLKRFSSSSASSSGSSVMYRIMRSIVFSPERLPGLGLGLGLGVRGRAASRLSVRRNVEQ